MSDKPSGIPSPSDFFNWMSQFAQPMADVGAKMAEAMPGVPGIPTGTDPLSMWKDLQQKNEQALTQYMAEMVKTPEFAQNLGQTASGVAAWREAVRRSAQAYLEAANMPTREDLTRIAGLVVALDAKVDDVDARLEEAGLGGLGTRLDSLDQQTGLASRLQELETRQVKLDELNAKLDLLLGLSERLIAVEDKLDKLAGAANNQAAQHMALVAELEKQTQAAASQPPPTTAPHTPEHYQYTESEAVTNARPKTSRKPIRAAKTTEAQEDK